MSLGGSAQLAANRRGIFAMTGAMAAFIVNDALIKVVSRSLPAGQMIFVRGMVVVALILAVAHATGATARLGDLARRRVALRGIIDASATTLYLASLVHLPIANATAINLAAPLFMTLFAMLFMNEKVGPAGALAVLAGFVGVLLVIQPRAAGFNAWALVCLAATLLHAVRDLMTRRIAAGVPSILIALASAIAACVIAGIYSMVEGWRPFGLIEAALLGAAAVAVATGYYFIIASFRLGDVAVIAPFRYSALLFALLLGYVVWGDVPNPLAWCGIGLVIGAGLFVIVAERRRANAVAPP